ncbi:hypothetical protein WICPIJ_002407 [Wickerhamomyces pijperi]|uniref:Chloride channel protein n=1 Tax=Wickerhamomyces pijperi TaxID=599730 RepID=A0A9P8Q9Q1_WICPI|nr:hypothetical protein WICPIJ_002407 [Wickerhamomyces pijperi]
MKTKPNSYRKQPTDFQTTSHELSNSELTDSSTSLDIDPVTTTATTRVISYPLPKLGQSKSFHSAMPSPQQQLRMSESTPLLAAPTTVNNNNTKDQTSKRDTQQSNLLNIPLPKRPEMLNRSLTFDVLNLRQRNPGTPLIIPYNSIGDQPDSESVSNHNSHTDYFSFAHDQIDNVLQLSESRTDTGSGTATTTQRDYYDDFTSVDWVKDSIKESQRQHKLNKKNGVRGTIVRFLDKCQDWILISLVACIFSLVAFFIDKSESTLIDLKSGYCQSNWLLNESSCCSVSKQPCDAPSVETCTNWILWSSKFHTVDDTLIPVEFLIYLVLSITLAYLSVRITLTTKTTANSLSSLHLDSNLSSSSSSSNSKNKKKNKPRTIYSAYGSGVPEVKTIISGFIIRKYLGTYTLIAKASALVFAIASGMSLGKEGPFVHLATCVGNIMSRLFRKFNDSELERRQILSAAASAGVACAFGSPLGGVLFSLEEVSYYLPGNQLFKTFFCAIMSLLFLRFLNPYGTGKTVLFEINYTSDWNPYEIALFVIIGIVGGLFGALFCKFTMWWPTWFRTKSYIKDHPITEVLLIAGFTALISYGNEYTRIGTPELLLKLSSPCFSSGDYTGDKGLCPLDFTNIPEELHKLLSALVIKIVLTGVTFGIKVPAGVYVPSMVIGALFGRAFAMSIQYLAITQPEYFLFLGSNYYDGTSPIVDFGIYAMIAAASFMAGVTRMNVTLATIMFELTSSYTFVLPISISIAVSNWVAYAIEPRSLYELLIFKNNFPFLANKKLHDFTSFSDLRELLRDSVTDLNIAIEQGISYVRLDEMQRKLTQLQNEGLIDGCIPLVQTDNGDLVGMLSAPELELALDQIMKFCFNFEMDPKDISIKLFCGKELDDSNNSQDLSDLQSLESSIFKINRNQDNLDEILTELTDFTRIIEFSPVMIDINSPLSLVEIIFTKLGNRSICVMENGKFAGFLHKKIFIDYCRDKMIL